MNEINQMLQKLLKNRKNDYVKLNRIEDLLLNKHKSKYLAKKRTKNY